MVGKKFTITGRHAYENDLEEDEKLYFQRELNNPHDANAIAVHKYDGETVGHLTKDTASYLAPFMQFDTCVFGKVSKTYYGSFNTKIIVEKIIENPRYAVVFK